MCRDLPSIESFAHTLASGRCPPSTSCWGAAVTASQSNVLQSLSLPADDFVELDVDHRRLVSPALRRCRRSSPDAHRVRHTRIDDSRNQTQNSPSSPLLLWSSVVGGWVRFVSARLLISSLSPRPLFSAGHTTPLGASPTSFSLARVTSLAYPESQNDGRHPKIRGYPHLRSPGETALRGPSIYTAATAPPSWPTPPHPLLFPSQPGTTRRKITDPRAPSPHRPMTPSPPWRTAISSSTASPVTAEAGKPPSTTAP